MKNVTLKLINPLENLIRVKELLLQLDPEKGEIYIQGSVERRLLVAFLFSAQNNNEYIRS